MIFFFDLDCTKAVIIALRYFCICDTVFLFFFLLKKGIFSNLPMNLCLLVGYKANNTMSDVYKYVHI